MSSAWAALDVRFYLFADMSPSRFLVKTFYSAVSCCSARASIEVTRLLSLFIFNFYHSRLRISLQDDPSDGGTPQQFSSDWKKKILGFPPNLLRL